MNMFEANKIAGAFLMSLLIILVIGYIGDILVPAPKVKHGDEMAAASHGGGKSAGTPAPATAQAAPIADRLKLAVSGEGEKAFGKKCASCHTANDGGANKIGPNLYNVVGGPKAHLPGFGYSDAMKKAGGNWAYDTLDAFLENPKAAVPGTKMTFAGIKDAKERANLVAYLRGQSAAPKPLP
ncbi:MAG: c-type cytochrome [Alphaproteobacteria bacterium]